MPPKHQIGAYQREKLTVFISLREAPADVIVNLAHSADLLRVFGRLEVRETTYKLAYDYFDRYPTNDPEIDAIIAVLKKHASPEELGKMEKILAMRGGMGSR